jgi:hypothetical protein
MSVADLIFYYGGEMKKMNIDFENFSQRGVFSMHASGTQLSLVNARFNIRIPENEKLTFYNGDTDDLDDRVGVHFHVDYESIRLLNVDFGLDTSETNLVPFEWIFKAENFTMINSRVDYITRLSGDIKNGLIIDDCRFPESIDPLGLQFPESHATIPFRQFRDTRFVKIDIPDKGYSVEGDSARDFDDEKFTDQLTSFYKKLYDNYRGHADLNSANAVYVRLKELEITHLKGKEDKDLEERMRLWLNRFMGFYTNHATSPGRGIIVSFWIVVAFAIFYFFFPSEWDKESKKQLAHDFRIFIEKNEHGYVKPFFKMLRGFLHSFVNALTLSMNAFITLGFGNIPTAGLARYVCVLQGVLGWFLLSLFTVALLNQVLL